jgi:hypothetical protein
MKKENIIVPAIFILLIAAYTIYKLLSDKKNKNSVQIPSSATTPAQTSAPVSVASSQTPAPSFMPQKNILKSMGEAAGVVNATRGVLKNFSFGKMEVPAWAQTSAPVSVASSQTPGPSFMQTPAPYFTPRKNLKINW